MSNLYKDKKIEISYLLRGYGTSGARYYTVLLYQKYVKFRGKIVEVELLLENQTAVGITLEEQLKQRGKMEVSDM